MSERPTEFVVQRSKWLRGQEDAGLLLNRYGAMCCLGFVAKQCGLDNDALLDQATPSCVAWGFDGVSDMELLDGVLTRVIGQDQYGDDIWDDTGLSGDAVAINDDATIVDSEREAQLIALFAKHGFVLRFEP